MGKRKIYCTKCKRGTTHFYKLGLAIEGKGICKMCGSINGIYTLRKVKDKNWVQTGSKISWVEWEKDEVGSPAKKKVNRIKIGRSLVLSPGWSYKWLTTPVVKIVSRSEYKIRFQTKNTLYDLYHPLIRKRSKKVNNKS